MTPMMSLKTAMPGAIVYVALRVLVRVRVPAQQRAAAPRKHQQKEEPRQHQQNEEGPRANAARGAQ